MERYTILHPLAMACYSKSLYRAIGHQWRGWGLLYLLILALLCSLPFAYRLAQDVTGLTTNAVLPLVAQLPTITIQQGQVTIDKTEPFFINNSDNTRALAIIDTTGATKLENTTAFVLLSKNNLS